jgi:hypothetical protein
MSSVSANEEKVLITRSGGMCAFPGCSRLLIVQSGEPNNSVFTGRVCHIVAQSRQGPRGAAEIDPEDRDQSPNLILLCQDHHDLVDKRPQTFSVRVLLAMKADHEANVAQKGNQAVVKSLTFVKEKLHSTCLAVAQMPGQIFAAPSAFKSGQEDEIKSRRDFSNYKGQTPFFLAEDQLFSFCDLRESRGPFAAVVDCRKATSVSLESLRTEREGRNRIIRLLNMSMRQYLGAKNISYDREHTRFFFRPNDPGQPRTESYRSVGNRDESRKVVWQPVKRATGEPRSYWYHLAAGVRFNWVAEDSCVLSLRPERRLTTDGETPYYPQSVGRKVTRLKARMYNAAYLSEVHFWRTVLCQTKGFFQLSFGHQHVVIDSHLLAFDVEWPGISDTRIQFKAEHHEEDLFEFAERKAAIEDDLDSEDDDDSGT